MIPGRVANWPGLVRRATGSRRQAREAASGARSCRRLRTRGRRPGRRRSFLRPRAATRAAGLVWPGSRASLRRVQMWPVRWSATALTTRRSCRCAPWSVLSACSPRGQKPTAVTACAAVTEREGAIGSVSSPKPLGRVCVCQWPMRVRAAVAHIAPVRRASLSCLAVHASPPNLPFCAKDLGLGFPDRGPCSGHGGRACAHRPGRC